jgi:hypothetical protein
MTGSATFKIVVSRVTRRRLTQSTARMSPRSRMGRTGGVPGIPGCTARSAVFGREVSPGSGPETEALIDRRTIVA